MAGQPFRCAVLGQSPMRYPWGFDEEDSGCRKMKIELAQQVMKQRHLRWVSARDLIIWGHVFLMTLIYRIRERGALWHVRWIQRLMIESSLTTLKILIG